MIDQREWVQACRHAADWRQAVALAVQPLITHQAVKPEYLQGIIDNTLEWGPYYVVAPGIALPHARPEQGALRNQISVTTLVEPVVFGHEDCDPVWLLIGLSAVDAKQHILTIQRISNLLSDTARLDALRAASSDEALFMLLRGSAQ